MAPKYSFMAPGKNHGGNVMTVPMYKSVDYYHGNVKSHRLPSNHFLISVF